MPQLSKSRGINLSGSHVSRAAWIIVKHISEEPNATHRPAAPLLPIDLTRKQLDYIMHD